VSANSATNVIASLRDRNHRIAADIPSGCGDFLRFFACFVNKKRAHGGVPYFEADKVGPATAADVADPALSTAPRRA
jgi:hypothetical protein